ncbi:MAG: carboxypeptidase regulatory-like domain-containing protein [Deferribacteres bacterium]|nr:carboxypeptidase regulatory-like domain-containing protein [Deferribacteres bacterium]
MAVRDIDRDIILDAHPGRETDFILGAKTYLDRGIVLQGTTSRQFSRYAVLAGSQLKNSDADIIIAGKNFFERDYILYTKSQNEIDIVLNADDPPEIYVRYSFREDEMEDFLLSPAGRPTNEITINYAYDFVSGKARQSITKHNPVSKILYGQNRKTLNLRMIHGTRQAEKIADAILKTSSIPPVKVSFIHDLRSFHLEVGDLVTITHRAGMGDDGYKSVIAMITKKRFSGTGISYEAIIKPQGLFYKSELMTLSHVSEAGREGVTVTYEHGVATITIYADVQGYPPVEGAEITISGVTKISDKNGQVRFKLEPGTYTASIKASGYDDSEVTFTV